MIRACWKGLILVAVVVGMITLATPSADACWGWRACRWGWGVAYAPCCGGWCQPYYCCYPGPYCWYSTCWGYAWNGCCWDAVCEPIVDCCVVAGSTAVAPAGPAEGQAPVSPTPAAPVAPSPTPAPTEPAPTPAPAPDQYEAPAPAAPKPNTKTLWLPTRETSGLLTVWVPADAKVIINGMLTRSRGSRREYVSHGLQPGLTYRYEVTAQIVREGKMLEETRVVFLTAGAKEGLAFGFNPKPAEVAQVW